MCPDLISSPSTPAAHKNSHKSGGGDAFVKGDDLDASAKYLEDVSDPSSDSQRIWIEDSTSNLKFWSDDGSPVKRTVATLDQSQTLTNKSIDAANNTLTNIGTSSISNDAVTYAKIQNVSAASKLLGRGDSGSGDPEEITLGTNLSMSGTTLNASGGGGGGDSISVNSTAANDADFDDATPAAPTDAVNVKWQKDAGTPNNISAYLDVETVTNKILANMAANTVKANNTGSTGDPVDVSIPTNTVLGRKGSNIVAETIITAQIADDQVTYAKMQDISATDRLLGRDTAAAGNTEEISVSGGLEFTGSGGIQRSALSGDITTAAGSGSTLVKKASEDYAFTGDISPTQITTNQNDYNPSGLSTAAVLRLNTDASRNITGLAGGADGRIIIIHNVGANDIVLTNQDAGSTTAANRFLFGANVTVRAEKSVILYYDSTTSRWRLLSTAETEILTAQLGNDQVTFAKIQNITTDRLLGRDTASSGDTEEISVTGGIEFTGSTSIQTSAFTGDVTKTAGGTATTIANDAVSNTKAANMAANTAKVNNTNATADPTDLSIGTNTVLGRKGGDIVAETIATAQVADDAITYAKIQNVSTTSRFLGRITSGAGDTEELTGTQATSLLDVAGASTTGVITSSSQTIGGAKTFNAKTQFEIETAHKLIATPTLPATGYGNLYYHTTDKVLKQQKLAGINTILESLHSPTHYWQSGVLEPCITNASTYGILGVGTVTGTASNTISEANGHARTYDTGTTSGNNAGFRVGQASGATFGSWDTIMLVRFSVSVIANSRGWFGFTTANAAPTGDTEANNKSYFAFGWRTTDTNYQIIHNDGDASAEYNDTGVALSTGVHTIILFCDPANSRWGWSRNLGDVTFVTTEIPANNTALNWVWEVETSNTTAKVLSFYALKAAHRNST